MPESAKRIGSFVVLPQPMRPRKIETMYAKNASRDVNSSNP